MKIKFLFIYILTLGMLSCDTNDDAGVENCDETVIMDAQLFQNAPADQLTINDISIAGNCLKINFSASGCDGNSWEIKLIDAEQILESEPIQRRLRLSLKNEELCQAFIMREVTFDLSALLTDHNPIRLNITDWDDIILYEL